MSLGLTIALAALVVALALVTWGGLRAWRSWQSLWRTVDAAEALIDVHLGAIDDRTEATAAAIAAVAGSSERAADGWSSAIAGVRELGVLASAVQGERARLKRQLLDLVLPTEPATRRYARPARGRASAGGGDRSTTSGDDA